MTVWLSNGTISLKRIQSEKCHQVLGQICIILLLNLTFRGVLIYGKKMIPYSLATFCKALRKK